MAACTLFFGFRITCGICEFSDDSFDHEFESLLISPAQADFFDPDILSNYLKS